MTILYKQNKSGSFQQWSIVVKANTYVVTFGQVDGAMQSQTTICYSKNIGKANESTPEQQAQLEAKALIAKKIKSGYSHEMSNTPTVQLAMKVKIYQDQLHNVIFPCYSTPKLNGINGMYRRMNGKITLYSRGGEVYPSIPHLTQQIHLLMNVINSNELNGELYIPNTPLQDIQAAVIKPNQLSTKLTFALFDIADSTEPYHIRNSILEHTLQAIIRVKATEMFSHVRFLIGKQCNTTEDIESHYVECMSLGLEGTVIKNARALYQHNIRSSDMFKYKKAQSAEFRILSYELDKHGSPVFTLQCTAGEFKAKPIGSREFWKLFDPSEYIGNWATCEFETLSKSGIPLKPIFISLRACDDNGKPKE